MSETKNQINKIDEPCPSSNMKCPCGCEHKYCGICLRPYPCKDCNPTKKICITIDVGLDESLELS